MKMYGVDADMSSLPCRDSNPVVQHVAWPLDGDVVYWSHAYSSSKILNIVDAIPSLWILNYVDGEVTPRECLHPHVSALRVSVGPSLISLEAWAIRAVKHVCT
jgi:hypothetical protein